MPYGWPTQAPWAGGPPPSSGQPKVWNGAGRYLTDGSQFVPPALGRQTTPAKDYTLALPKAGTYRLSAPASGPNRQRQVLGMMRPGRAGPGSALPKTQAILSMFRRDEGWKPTPSNGAEAPSGHGATHNADGQGHTIGSPATADGPPRYQLLRPLTPSRT